MSPCGWEGSLALDAKKELDRADDVNVDVSWSLSVEANEY